MSKTKVFILIAAFVIVVGGVFTGFVLLSNNKSTNQESSNTSDSQLANESTSELTSGSELKAYEDPSGFSFQYPGDWNVKDITPDDQSFYTKLELSKSSNKVILSIYDVQYKTLNEWQKDVNNKYRDAKVEGAASLGGIAISQYKQGEMLISAGLDQGILYLIEANAKDEATYSKIITSFKLGEEAAKNKQLNETSDNTIYEAEEVVQ